MVRVARRNYNVPNPRRELPSELPKGGAKNGISPSFEPQKRQQEKLLRRQSESSYAKHLICAQATDVIMSYIVSNTCVATNIFCPMIPVGKNSGGA